MKSFHMRKGGCVEKLRAESCFKKTISINCLGCITWKIDNKQKDCL